MSEATGGKHKPEGIQRTAGIDTVEKEQGDAVDVIQKNDHKCVQLVWEKVVLLLAKA